MLKSDFEKGELKFYIVDINANISTDYNIIKNVNRYFNMLSEKQQKEICKLFDDIIKDYDPAKDEFLNKWRGKNDKQTNK